MNEKSNDQIDPTKIFSNIMNNLQSAQNNKATYSLLQSLSYKMASSDLDLKEPLDMYAVYNMAVGLLFSTALLSNTAVVENWGYVRSGNLNVRQETIDAIQELGFNLYFSRLAKEYFDGIFVSKSGIVILEYSQKLPKYNKKHENKMIHECRIHYATVDSAVADKIKAMVVEG